MYLYRPSLHRRGQRGLERPPDESIAMHSLVLYCFSSSPSPRPFDAHFFTDPSNNFLPLSLTILLEILLSSFFIIQRLQR